MAVLVVCLALFGVGLYGVLVRRDLVGVLASIEVMIGGALLLLVVTGAWASSSGGGGRVASAALLILVLAAAEAALGLALVVAVARSARTTRIDEITEVRG